MTQRGEAILFEDGDPESYRDERYIGITNQILQRFTAPVPDSFSRRLPNAKMGANLHLGLLLLRNLGPGRCDERVFEISAWAACVRLHGLARWVQDS